MQPLISKQAHEWSNIKERQDMKPSLTMSNEVIINPLSITFRNCIKQHISRYIEEIEYNSYSYKEDKQSINNFIPVSILSYVEKYLKDYLLNLCFNIWRNTNYYQLINLVFKPVIFVLINCCPLSIIFIQPLTHSQL